MIKNLSHLTALGIGYFSAPTTLLFTILPISQPMADEIARTLCGLVVAVVSRWIYGKFDGNRPQKNQELTNIVPDNQPDSLTLNNTNEDETKISK